MGDDPRNRLSNRKRTESLESRVRGQRARTVRRGKLEKSLAQDGTSPAYYPPSLPLVETQGLSGLNFGKLSVSTGRYT